MSAAAPFAKGDALIVRPSDSDDPDAIAHAGESCTFVRRLDAPGGLSIYARVQFVGDPKERVLRMQDLIREDAK